MINSTKQEMNDQLCKDINRPQIRRLCNTQPCLSKSNNVTRRRSRRRRWDIGAWSSVKI
jgi:hypothetical protein